MRLFGEFWGGSAGWLDQVASTLCPGGLRDIDRDHDSREHRGA